MASADYLRLLSGSLDCYSPRRRGPKEETPPVGHYCHILQILHNCVSLYPLLPENMTEKMSCYYSQTAKWYYTKVYQDYSIDEKFCIVIYYNENKDVFGEKERPADPNIWTGRN